MTSPFANWATTRAALANATSVIRSSTNSSMVPSVAIIDSPHLEGHALDARHGHDASGLERPGDPGGWDRAPRLAPDLDLPRLVHRDPAGHEALLTDEGVDVRRHLVRPDAITHPAPAERDVRHAQQAGRHEAGQGVADHQPDDAAENEGRANQHQ